MKSLKQSVSLLWVMILLFKNQQSLIKQTPKLPNYKPS